MHRFSVGLSPSSVASGWFAAGVVVGEGRENRRILEGIVRVFLLFDFF